MKKTFLLASALISLAGQISAADLPGAYQYVDQVLWVVSDAENTMVKYRELGFDQFRDLGTVEVKSWKTESVSMARLICANLGGAHVNWIQPLEGESVFNDFLIAHGDAAMSLVHRFPDVNELKEEIGRLEELGTGVLDQISMKTSEGELAYVLMNTEADGKYVLGFTYEDHGLAVHTALCDDNQLELRLNQYAFAIKDPKPVSAFWKRIGLPELEIRHPELGEPMYYGKPAGHELIQGWQRHGEIAYEWCIPVKPPIVYEDHIKLHGEGIHHLAFSVKDMDVVLEDFTSKGFVVSMGGTWGEKDKPGSGRYEYMDLEQAGGLTMELLWNYPE
ncbi:MAG: VOC family protein [Bacteroidales bacterium]|nr:VOC family protein [Bacteroidales bacterium]